MTSSSTDRPAPSERARSLARLGRLVAALLLGLAALTGTALESTSSVLTDQVTVDVGVTTAPDFAITPPLTPMVATASIAAPAPLAAPASIAAPASADTSMPAATPSPSATPTTNAPPSTNRKGRG